MKRAGILFVWAVLLFGALVLIFSVTGCRLVKSTTKIKVTDSVKVVTASDSSKSVKHVDNSFVSHIEKDSTVGIPEKEVSLTLEDSAGAIDTTIRNGNVNLHVYTDGKGRQHIDCKGDSLTIVIARLIRDSINQSHTNDSAYVAIQKGFYEHVGTVNEKTVEVQAYPLWRKIIDWIIAAIIGVLVWEIGKVVFKICKYGAV